MRSTMMTLVWLFAAAFAFGCDDGTTDTEPPPEEARGDLVEVATEAGDFTTLLEAAEAAGLVDTLANGGPFTLFAPTDDAFAALPEGALEDLLADTDALTRVLQYHLVAGELTAGEVVVRASLDTVAGEALVVDAESDPVRIGTASIVSADILADNGVIHVIDSVLMPPMDEEPPAPEMDIVDTAVDAGTFGTLVAAVQAAGLEDTLRGEGPFTVFAPTDDAFAALPEGTVETLLMEENRDMLRDILLYHVVPGAVNAAAVTMAQQLETALGVDVEVAIDGETVTIGGAAIVATDIIATNGIIHVIDAVILPPEEEPEPDIVDTAIAAGTFETLVAAVQAAGLEETLRGEGPFTVFAPTDDAFDALPEGTVATLLMEENRDMLRDILLFHVVPGLFDAEAVLAAAALETALGIEVTVDAGTVTIGGAGIVTTDIMASNGIIHVIDAVILPPDDEPEADIVDTAIAAGTFETLVAAVQAADLVDTLRGEGTFTVFAPNDDAFDALPAGTVDMLLMPENIGMLTDILLYHVVPGAFDAAAVTASAQLETALGVTAPIDGASIDGANIIATDIMASNGIIHVIDAVIMPPGDIVDVAIEAGTFETLVAAVQAADLVETLRGEGPFTVFAPTDEAFAALPEGTVERLLQPENIDELRGILLLHVVPGTYFAADVVEAGALETAAGAMIDVQVGETVAVGGSTVMGTDIRARNGVIHVIDTVILPGD